MIFPLFILFLVVLAIQIILDKSDDPFKIKRKKK